jgi:L-iditol 2-dehydrogenase
VRAARPGARVALGGVPGTETSAFPAADARRKGLTFAMVRRMHDTYGRAIALATSGIDLDGLVSARFPLRDAAQAFERAAARAGDKTVVTVGG